MHRLAWPSCPTGVSIPSVYVPDSAGSTLADGQLDASLISLVICQAGDLQFVMAARQGVCLSVPWGALNRTRVTSV
jgi:hypothetical protein